MDPNDNNSGSEGTEEVTYEFPEGFDFSTLDIEQLDGEELEAAEQGAVEAFNALASSDAVTTEDITKLRELSTVVDKIREEQETRVEQAREAAAEIEELASKVSKKRSAKYDDERKDDGKFKPGNTYGPGKNNGNDQADHEDACEECGKAAAAGKDVSNNEACRECRDGESSGQKERASKGRATSNPTPSKGGSRSGGSKSGGSSKSGAPKKGQQPPWLKAAGALGDDAEEPEVVQGEVIASTSGGRRLDLSKVRRSNPIPKTPEAPKQIEIVAAVDVPGFQPGSAMDFDKVTQGIISRANALKTAGGGVGQVISYRLPFVRSQIVADSSSAPEGTTVAMWAQDQRNLPQADLVASGGWCAPSEQLYDLVDIACPDMLWDAPEIQLSRGGIRFFLTPSLNVAEMTFIHTEADDIAGKEKPCYKIPCPDPIEVRCDAVGVCLEAGILTQRHFPELVSWYLRNAMVAHEIRVRQVAFEKVVSLASTVTMPKTFGTFSAIFEAIALQSVDMIEKHSLCEGTALEVVLPYWSKAMMLADLTRQQGGIEADESDIQAMFTKLSVRVQFARGLSPAVPEDIGGEQPACTWPDEINFLLYPAGMVQIGRGEEVNLGAIHDSNKFKTNDYTALFSEECVAVVVRAPEIRYVTVPVCADGAVGARKEINCPLDCEKGKVTEQETVKC